MPTANAAEWARICRIEAARASHPATRDFLLDLATGYEAIAGEPTSIADRLMGQARKKSAEHSA